TMSTRRSLRAGRSPTSFRKRRPRRCNSERSATSGRVSTRRLPFISAVTAAEVGFGYGSWLGDELEALGGRLMIGLILRKGSPNRFRHVQCKRGRHCVTDLPEPLAKTPFPPHADWECLDRCGLLDSESAQP